MIHQRPRIPRASSSNPTQPLPHVMSSCLTAASHSEASSARRRPFAVRPLNVSSPPHPGPPGPETGWAAWPYSISRRTSPSSTCPVRRRLPTRTHTCARRWRGTSAPTPGLPSGSTPPSDLDFDPLTDVRTFTDLRLFPNLTDQLRSVPVEDLIPRGYGTPLPIPRIYESGGTTGAPKRTAQLPDWVEQVTRWQVEDFTAGGFVPGARIAVHDAERTARRRPLRPRGRRTTGVDLPPDRPGSALGQEAGGARRERRGGRVRRPRRRTGAVHPADAVRGQPARDAPAAGGRRTRRRAWWTW